MKLNHLISSLLLLASPVFADNPAVTVQPSPVDPIAEALPILQAKYADFKTLHYKQGDHLSDLIARSNGKISLDVLETAVPVPSTPVTLPGNILYWRLASFIPKKNWLETGQQLQQAAPSTVGVILDLRSTITPDEYRGAAQVLGFFAPGDCTCFRFSDTDSEAHSKDNAVRLAGGQFSFHSPIVVLTNNKTTGAAEALAACLKADGALVMGGATAGKMGVFEEQKLSSGQVLRYFVSPVSSTEDSTATFKIPRAPLTWGQPVTPDITMTVDDKVEISALDLIAQGQISEVIGESAERHRLSEAALVQGENPEEDAYLEAHEKKPVLLSLPVIHDTVLISALDSIKVIGLSQKQTASSTPADLHPASTTSVQ